METVIKTKKNNKKKNKKYKKRKTFKKQKFLTLKCAPLQKRKVDEKLKEKSCYSNKLLFTIRDKFNDESFDHKITSNNPKIIWKQLKKYNKECNNELCWMKYLNNIDKDKIFRPLSPIEWKKKPYMWLSSKDIIKVMDQYESKYPNFKFIGPSPIDFNDKKLYGTCVWEELCKFSLEKYIKNGKTKIGIILNLDPHYKSGSHWVAIFIDINKRYFFYFDSNGVAPNKRIKEFKNKVLEESNRLNINFDYYDNRNKIHQKKDGQCGMYCLYIIIKLLREDKEPLYFKKYRITDEEMRDYREIYFNTIN